jgi:hypothetical protein
MTWVLFLWLGNYTPTVIQGFTSEAKCEAFADKIQSPYLDDKRKKFQCLKLEK